MIDSSRSHESPSRTHKGVHVMAKDPVCGMEVQTEGALHKLHLGEETIYFCSTQCQDTYRQRRGLKKKGFFSRFIEKLAEDNQDSFGGTPPKCH